MSPKIYEPFQPPSGRFGDENFVENGRLEVLVPMERSSDQSNGMESFQGKNLCVRSSSEMLPPDLEDFDLGYSEQRLLGDGPFSERKRKTWVYLVMLTICLGGLQMAFSLQFAAGTNNLLALDISPTVVGVIWLLPPTCGALLQPSFGFWSDNCSSRFGRRKPFIIGGGICLSISLFTFAWTVEVSNGVAKLIGSTSCSKSGPTCPMAKFLATFSILAINVSAQAIQAGARAIIVDLCPSYLQSEVNAWASRICNLASILLYFASSLDLPYLMPFLGDTQLKGLSALGSFILLTTLSITCLGVPNAAVPRIDGHRKEGLNPLDFFKQLRTSMRTLPNQLSNIYRVQFFSWFAWYPFMVYISNYVGTSNIISAYTERSSVAMTFDETETSNRIGALSLFSLSAGALLTASVLPGILGQVSACDTTKLRWRHEILVSFFTYKNIWFTSQIIFSLCVFGVLVFESYVSMIFISSLMGFSWAVTQWVPFTLGNIAILDMENVAGHRPGGESGRVGMVLGIHNVCIAGPQILSSLACTLVFKLVSDGTVYNISWIFIGCGLVSLIAAAMVLQVENTPI